MHAQRDYLIGGRARSSPTGLLRRVGPINQALTDKDFSTVSPSSLFRLSDFFDQTTSMSACQVAHWNTAYAQAAKSAWLMSCKY